MANETAGIRDALNLTDYIRTVLLKQPDLYPHILTDRLLPLLSDEEICKEAERVEDEALDRLGNPEHFFEDARKEAVDYMLTLRDIRQGIINTFATGLYHQFEQQFSKVLRRAVWDRHRVFRHAHEVANEFINMGLDVKRLPGWKEIDELRLIANCIKHAEGESCQELRKTRPGLFVKPLWGSPIEQDDDAQQSLIDPFVEEPLGGKGVYLTEQEFMAKVKAIKTFWIAFAEAIDSY